MEITPETRVLDLAGSGYTLLSPEAKKQRKKFAERDRNNEHFIRVKERFSEVKEHLTLEQNGIVLFMVSLMKKDSDGVLYHNRKKVSVSDLAQLVGKSERQVRRVIEELELLSLVVREREGRNVFLSLGETFFNCGYSEESFRFVKLYKARLQEIAGKLSLSELGLFMLLTSQFHWKTHLLCDNPSERDSNNIVIWKRKHIAEEFGVSIDFVKRAIPKLRKVRAIYEVKTVKSGIVLDPSLVCRQPIKPTIEEILNTIEKCDFKKSNVKK